MGAHEAWKQLTDVSQAEEEQTPALSEVHPLGGLEELREPAAAGRRRTKFFASILQISGLLADSLVILATLKR